MKKSKLTSLLVLSLTGFVPLVAGAQGAPDAMAEGATKVAAAKTDNPLTLAENAPNSYTVVKGDTLWGISGRFLKEPWRWPEIWNMNREQIKDPHWIYPGDVIHLTYDASGRPQLSLSSGGGTIAGQDAGNVVGGTIKLNPQVRVDRQAMAIPSIPSKDIGPFLSLPLVIEAGTLDKSPKIVAAEESRVIIGAGNTAYAVGITPAQGTKWQIYRPGRKLTDPVTRELLGYEAIYLGEAKVTRFGESSTLEILRSTQEINRGDRLTPTVESTLPSYSPHAPDKQLKGAVVSILDGMSDAGQYAVVAVNLGRRDGVEIGHVLATLQKGEIVSTLDRPDSSESGFRWSSLWSSSADKDGKEDGEDTGKVASRVKLPDERNGLVFIFRVFDRVSYALVMSSRRSLKVGDVIQTP